MNRKARSFFEDLVVIFVVIAIIYGVYSFFFSSEEEQIKEVATIENRVETNNTSNIPVVEEKKIEETQQDIKVNNEQITNVQKELTAPSSIENRPQTPIIESTTPPVVIVEQAKEIAQQATIKEPIKTDVNVIKEPTVVQNNQLEAEEKVKVEQFFEGIRKQILENLDTTLDKSKITKGEYTNFKVTVLKDGGYEQITYLNGNKEYYELIKPAIRKAFPVQIDPALKNSFPRYFRMKIEF